MDSLSSSSLSKSVCLSAPVTTTTTSAISAVTTKSTTTATVTATQVPDMLAWSRLPTPVPSGTSSPTLHPRSLSIFTAPSSSTSGTTTTTTYAINDSLLPSPLPSPGPTASFSNSNTSMSDSASGNETGSSVGSKTAAFFASPFSSAGPPTPVPPPNPLYLRGANTSASSSIDAKGATPKSEDTSLNYSTNTKPDTKPATRSATADFFAMNSFDVRPTPPPSLSSDKSSSGSLSSREPSPPPLLSLTHQIVQQQKEIQKSMQQQQQQQPIRLPPLSRFFPSRYTTDPTHDIGLRVGDDDASMLELDAHGNGYGYGYGHGSGRKGGTDWETSFKREFLSLAEKAESKEKEEWEGKGITRSPTEERAGFSYEIERGSEERIQRPSVPPPLPPKPTSLVSTPHISQPQASTLDSNSGTHTHPHTDTQPRHNPNHHVHHNHHHTHAHSHSHHSHPIRRETQGVTPLQLSLPSSSSVISAQPLLNDELVPGAVLKTESVCLTLERALGEGAFSSVWLAADNSNILGPDSDDLPASAAAAASFTASNSASASLPLLPQPQSQLSDRARAAASSLTTDVELVGTGTKIRRKSESRAKRESDDVRMCGIRPTSLSSSHAHSLGVGVGSPLEQLSSDGVRNVVCDEGGESGTKEDSIVLDEMDGEGASASTSIAALHLPLHLSSEKHDESPSNDVISQDKRHSKKGEESKINGKGRLVAVKTMNRAMCDANDRTRTSFVREVEVLRHISHPSIVSYLHSFSTHTYHCLVLEHIGGGELFTLVNSDEQHARVTQPALRRMWGELCRAVGWMHGVALVHRDIKLENILLTTNIFAPSSSSSDVVLPPLSVPLIKLTDFGLSRFIDPDAPLLSTRCGSEAYAAPELVLGRMALSRAGSQSQRVTTTTSTSTTTESARDKEGYYDPRQTDAWACGVVLYALATRALPFDPPVMTAVSSVAPSRDGSLRRRKSAMGSRKGRRRTGQGEVVGTVQTPVVVQPRDAKNEGKRRRDMLMRIAQCEYTWPDDDDIDNEEGLEGWDEADPELEPESESESNLPISPPSLVIPELKRVVDRLLVRDPTKRARLVELWDEPWLRGEGAPNPPACACAFEYRIGVGDECGGEGALVDEEHIASVARQEENESEEKY